MVARDLPAARGGKPGGFGRPNDSMKGPGRGNDRLAIALLLLLPTLFFGDVLLGFGNFYMRDLTRYYYPTKQIYREIALGGELPLWNRYFHAGQPLAANPEHEIFYPLTWLILLPNYDLGYRLHILVHIYIGLLGMYALLRSMELRPEGAFFGALSFGLGGIYLSYINLLPILFCAAWLPLTCLFVRRFLLHPNLRDFGRSALMLGMQFLVAEPTTVMQTGLMIGLYGLYRGWHGKGDEVASVIRRGGRMLGNTAWIALISTMGFAVGAAQMLAALDHVGDSARSRAFEFTLVKAWSMPWAKFAELIYPNILGHISVDRVMWYWGGGVYPGMGSPFLFSIYCGLAVITLAVAGMFSRRRGSGFVILFVVFSSLIALGSQTPLLKLLYDAGIATSIRYPEKFTLIAVFALIVFAAKTLDAIIDGDQALRDTAVGFAMATTVVAILLAIVAFTPFYAEGFRTVWGQAAGAGANRMISLSRIDWVVAAVRGLLLVALLLTAGTRFRKLWLSAGLLFLCVDLGPVMHELNPRMPSRFFTRAPEAVKQLKPGHRDYRVFHEADWYGGDETARKYFSTGNAVYWVVRNGLFPMTPVGHGIQTVLERDYDKTALIPTIDLTDSLWDVKRAGKADWYQPFMAMSNAWYRGVHRDFEDEKKRTGGDFKKSLPVRFLEGTQYPRYYFADQIVRIADRQDFVKKLIADSYSDRVAFVQQPSFVPGAGKILTVKETANTAIIDVEADARAFLVMSVTPHKYWRVTIDGRSVKPVVTNIGYQGLIVPPGRHRVSMRYRNDLIAIGLPVSGAAAGLLVLIAFLPRRKSASNH